MNQEIGAHELDTLLEQLPPQTKVLSLDCFDTILWRKVARPTDVFFSLQSLEPFRSAGITAALRAKAESELRRRKQLLTGNSEVTLEDIHRELLPHADPEGIAQAGEVEIACEIAHAFIFEPIARLIRSARAKGLRVIVVSDIYFTGKQLGHMLGALMGETADALSHIYCSCDFGASKTSGIWKEVLRREKVQPQQVFHLGDNRHADLQGAARYGIASAWLRQHPASVARQLEQRASAAVQLMPELRNTHALPSYFHGLLAATDTETLSAAQQIGYRSLGPILCSFGRFIEQQLQALKAAGKQVKIAFLLRDGYLPAKVCEILMGSEGLHQINVSRFTAIASSLQTKADVVRLLTSSLSESSMPAMAKQLLLPLAKAQALLDQATRSDQPTHTFTRLVLRDDTLKLVFQQSAAFRERMFTHVRQRTGLAPGETLVLVDLGYSGTAQTRLAPVFKQAMDVDLFGLYLIASRVKGQQTDRKGLIDASWADERLILAMTAYIGLFEMMCTTPEASTVDYTEQGEPIRSQSNTARPQSVVVADIQAACLRFVADMARTPERHQPRQTPLELAHQAAADLGRLIYFPSAPEIECLSAFEFDFNLGTDLLLPTANLQAGVHEYRKEGFALMNQELKAMRISYPMEMRQMDISLATTLLSAQRFGYSLAPSEASFRTTTIPTLIANRDQHALVQTQATATFDGYYRLHLPMSAAFDQSLLLGQTHEWLQLDSIQKVPLDDKAPGEDLVLGEAVLLDGLEQVEGTLVKFSPGGMMYFPACGSKEHGRFMIRVVFRPVLARAESTPVASHSAHDRHTAIPPLQNDNNLLISTQS